MNITGKNLKTISSMVKMEMIDDVLHFHGKGNIVVDQNFFDRLAPHTLTNEQLKTLERSDFEVVPFHHGAIKCDVDEDLQIRRWRSASQFADEKIPFSKIKSLLKNSFCMSKDGSRPYASGGALYPVEVICTIFSEKINDGPASGFYHYRPTLNILQPIKLMDSKLIRDILYRIESRELDTPNFSLLYVGGIGKMLVKYRYRGYRHALMEAGAMFHQADLVAQSLGMINKVYSGFNDHEVMQTMGLDKMSFLPFIVQSFGVQ